MTTLPPARTLNYLPGDPTTRRPIPLPLKLAYTGFCAVLIPVYWHAYTPWNFLYFCDFALLLTLVGMWLESPFLISMQAVAILMPQTIWVVDFTATALGHPLLGMTKYMFNPSLSLFARGLSSFHGWLPFVLAFLVYRVGYDRRAFPVQCVFGVALLWFCFFFAPAPPAPAAHPNMAVNLNYVWGTDDAHPQHVMAPALWVMTLCSTVVVGFYTPTHLILGRAVRPARTEIEEA